MTYNEAAVKFLELKKAETKPETMRFHKGKVSVVAKNIGNMEIEEIDKFVIAKFTNEQRERNPNISNRTLNYYRSNIVQVVEIVSDRKINIKKLKLSKKKVPALSDDTVEKILTHLYQNRNRGLYKHYYKYFFMIRLMLDTGARLNEVINLKVSQFDVSDRSILLKVTKNSHERYVFFKKDLVDVYLKYINRYELDNKSFLFPGATEGSHLSKEAVMRFMIKLQKRLGIEKSISTHKLRHTMATKYIANNGGLYDLQQLLGHEDVTTTTIYTEISKETLKEFYNSTMK
jgi:integrase/recombinase XerD